MIGDWQDEWDLKRRGSDRSVNRHDTCREAAYLNMAFAADSLLLRLKRTVMPSNEIDMDVFEDAR